MKLDRFEIKNFRSIKDMTIPVSHNCLVLLGKNEAGKSNILKAIAAIYGKYEITAKDRRKKIDNEKINPEDYLICAVYKLSVEEYEKIHTEVIDKITGSDTVRFGDDLTLLDFIKDAFDEIAYKNVITSDSTPEWKYYSLEKNKKFKLSYELIVKSGAEISTDFDTDGVTGEVLTNDKLVELIWPIVESLISNTITNCNYWNYSSEYLLPSEIVIEDFKANPSICKPLQNIFTVCNRGNIAEELDNAFSEDGDYENIFEQISTDITRIFREIWPDFKDTSINLSKDGNLMKIKVRNKVKYNFEDRSDGFKKFISILLMLSTQARANKLSHTDIILIDEPDQSLYPTSARYLMNELLKISENSLLLYSTHSQYMIDSDCVERHLVIEKKDDVTNIVEQTRKSPLSTDELLKRAIGVSIFECIKDKNIIFEGWFDKELLLKWCSFNNTKLPENVGFVYLSGISSYEALVQIMILAHKKFIIISDSDKASIDKKKDFHKSYSEYKDCWIDYQSVTDEISTMEDYMKEEHLEKYIKEVCSNDFVYDSSKYAIDNIKNMASSKEKIQTIKHKLVENLTTTTIKIEYNNFVTKVLEKIEAL